MRKRGVLMEMTIRVTIAIVPVERKSRMMTGRLLSIVSTSRENLLYAQKKKQKKNTAAS